MELIDSHVHLDDEQFDNIRSEVIDRAITAGISRMVCIGTNAPTSRKCVEIANAHESVFAAVGIQPNYASDVGPDDWDSILALTKDPRVVAVGETGLDHYWDYAPIDVQQEYFELHLELSRTSRLPFIVHMRDCEEKMMDFLAKSLNEAGRLNGVMHSFCGSADAAKQCLQWGMHISFAGMVTYKKNDSLRTIAAEIPDDRLLIETDAPYLSPHPCRSTRPNQPALVRHTLQCLAETRGVDAETLAETTSKNALTFFGINA